MSFDYMLYNVMSQVWNIVEESRAMMSETCSPYSNSIIDLQTIYTLGQNYLLLVQIITLLYKQYRNALGTPC